MQAGADSRFGAGAAACHERPSAVTVPRLHPYFRHGRGNPSATIRFQWFKGS